ncbi:MULTISPECIES: DUF1302 domain-containing protein [unclassified Pseudomonas]|uniref:DUF1302 domain-containing protein n=1 Tax=unclassified Pseudomonas TaxID=196821 RepID=UPI002AC9118F|nr:MULTISPECIES: DUF1302 domain-containing protein [unclassified Pseudomonas]MEB0039295.1 DUF1302 domain-containing protein [Pseudomonas sp. MH10]MEB0076057.1 DUF1302 domain-containing protein [Pseudomonas sp. MH10out]MEB0090837.1 DUF1302 domain-containing protein [Pseudomonas sp. CCI4.2]MEB0100142.1 DUF1302 domain-containing protein [Pseudomonas sp. CCI3.2]MEB0119734.1 DUF1302 domain-containing protein [Pseudomonas sp. CCI1.2]
MTTRTHLSFRRTPWLSIATLTLTPLACAISLSARATDFDFGEITGRYNGNITAGALWSTQSPTNSTINQGSANSIGYGHAGQFNNGGGRTSDDSRLNFHKPGELVSSPITLLAETELKWKNYGLFLRGKAWYDYTLENKEVDYGSSANGYQQNQTLNDAHYDKLAKFQGVELLDAYVYGNYDIEGHPLNVRAGKQVVSWGEGLFFQNGINAINPLDVAALRRPGAQLKEGLLPVPMLYGNFGITDSLSVESFYQLAWRKTVLEGCGTFFSTNDYIPDGCYGVPRAGSNDQASFANGQIIQRAPDKDPRNMGQFGFALRYFADEIGTEFGAYAMNIHSRTPYSNSVIGARSIASGPYPGWVSPTTSPALAAGNGEYDVSYPEDIRIFGVSFSTTVLSTSVFGELSYRPNQPVQLASADLIAAFAALPPGTGKALGIPLASEAYQVYAPGTVVDGYERLKVTQLSLGAVKTFQHVLGADTLSLVGEMGMKYMNNLPSLSDARFGRTDQYGSDLASGSVAGCAIGTASNPKYAKLACSKDGYTTKFSSGYRLKAQLTYNSLLAGINVSPYMAFGQDIKGWSYDGNFVQDRLLGSVGVKADYLQKYSADLSWSGSGNTPWATTDKDFVAFSVSMGF